MCPNTLKAQCSAEARPTLTFGGGLASGAWTCSHALPEHRGGDRECQALPAGKQTWPLPQ